MVVRWRYPLGNDQTRHPTLRPSLPHYIAQEIAMQTRSKLFSLFILLALAMSLSGCAKDPNEEFIQGTWEPSAEIIKLTNQLYSAPRSGSVHVYNRWAFEDGRYYYIFDNTFTKDEEMGRYRVLESDGDTMRLELYDIKGTSLTTKREISVIIDREAGTLRIQRGTYTRIE